MFEPTDFLPFVKIFLLCLIPISILWLYLSNKCPSCHMPFAKIYQGKEALNERTIDKEVYIKPRDGNGNAAYEKQKILTTYINYRYFWICKYCGHEWHKNKLEEKHF